METLDMFKDEIYANLLKNYIVADSLELYPHFEWLEKQVDFLLNYDSYGCCRPVELRNLFYDTFQELFPYNGVIYHGFVSFKDKEEVIKGFNGLLSFSSNAKVAYNFATGCDNITSNIIIKERTNDGFDFRKFLITIGKYISINNYHVCINEYEILAPHNFNNYTIINCKDKKFNKLNFKKGDD